MPLNFTKSINLALSERGINSIRQARCPGLLKSIVDDTIPMYARMIHGMENGRMFEQSQAYDVQGRVSCSSYSPDPLIQHMLTLCRQSALPTAAASTGASLTSSRGCQM